MSKKNKRIDLQQSPLDIQQFNSDNKDLYLKYKKIINKNGINKTNVEDIFNLGLCYETGKGTLINLKESLYYYNQAANKNSDKAQYKLAKFYEYGYDVEINIEEALKWYKLSAENGNKKAQNILAYYYENGIGVEKNLKEAFTPLKI